jgi:hypothetical protein
MVTVAMVDMALLGMEAAMVGGEDTTGGGMTVEAMTGVGDMVRAATVAMVAHHGAWVPAWVLVAVATAAA